MAFLQPAEPRGAVRHGPVHRARSRAAPATASTQTWRRHYRLTAAGVGERAGLAAVASRRTPAEENGAELGGGGAAVGSK